MGPRALGFALVLFAATTWSLAGLGIKLLWSDALAVAGYRSLFALPVVWAFAVASARGRREVLVSASRPVTVRLAAVAYAATVIAFVAATKLTTAANAILLQYTAPIYVALLSWPIAREPLRRADWLAVVGCVFGIGWFFRERVSTEGTVGNVLALVSGVGFALLPLLLRSAGRSGDEDARHAPLVAIVLGNVLVVAVCARWMIVHPPPGAGALALVAGLGLVQLGLSYVAYSAGVARVRAVEAVLIATIEPILNPIWVAMGTGERPSSAAIVGGAVIVASVAVQGGVGALRTETPRG